MAKVQLGQPILLHMRKLLTLLGSLGCMVAVIAGAVGAHALHLEPGSMRAHNYDTAVIYLLVHGATVTLGGGLPAGFGSRTWETSRFLMVLGMVLFSGGILVSAWLELPKSLPVVPAGGMSLIAGWLLAAVAVWRWSDDSQETRFK